MLDNIVKIQSDANSKDVEISIPAVELIVKNINWLTSTLFESFESNGHFSFTTERISQAFDFYLQKLDEYLSSDNKELSFWAATLIVHHRINNKLAENILLNEIRTSLSDKVYIATTILCRVKNGEVIDAIRSRVKQENALDDVMLAFFREKLSDEKK